MIKMNILFLNVASLGGNNNGNDDDDSFNNYYSLLLNASQKQALG